MIALILAGGFATRLWPLTKDIPKPLLPIGNKRIIEYSLDQIAKMDIFSRIFISTNKVFEKQFAQWLSKYRAPNKISIITEPTLSEETKFGAIRGMAYDISVIEDKQGADDILILAGDNIFSFNIIELLEFFERKKAPVIATYVVDTLEKAKRFGVIEIDEDQRIISFKEKPKHPKSRLISIAVYLLPQDCIREVTIYLDQGNNPDAPGYFFEWLIKKMDIYAFKFEGYWFDIGTLDGYLEAMTKVFSTSKINPDAEIHGKIIHPVCTGEGVKVDSNSVIGPYAIIGNNVRINKSYVKRSLILENTEIVETTIEETLIGSDALVRGGRIKSSILASHTKLKIVV